MSEIISDKKQLLAEKRRQASRAYYARNQAADKARKLAYSQSEHGKAVKASYYQQNRERIIERAKAHYQNNKTQILAASKLAREEAKIHSQYTPPIAIMEHNPDGSLKSITRV